MNAELIEQIKSHSGVWRAALAHYYREILDNYAVDSESDRDADLSYYRHEIKVLDEIISALSQSAAAPEGSVVVPRGALECFMTTINAACQQLEGSVLYIKDQGMRASAAELAKHYHDRAAELQAALTSAVPEQQTAPKCKTCDDTKAVSIGTKTERCCCGGDSRCLICKGKIYYSSVVIGDCPDCTKQTAPGCVCLIKCDCGHSHGESLIEGRCPHCEHFACHDSGKGEM